MWEVCAPIASCGASHNIPSQLFCIFSNSFSFLGHVRMLPLLEGASRRSTKVITISDTELEYLLKSNQQSRNTRIKFSSSGLPSPFCNLPYLLSKAFFLNTSCRYQLIFTLHEPPNLGFWKSWRLVASLVFTLWSSGTGCTYPVCAYAMCRHEQSMPERGGITCSEAQSDGEWNWGPVSHHFPSGLSWLCSALRGCRQQTALPAAGHAALVSQGWEFWFCWTKMLFQK